MSHNKTDTNVEKIPRMMQSPSYCLFDTKNRIYLFMNAICCFILNHTHTHFTKKSNIPYPISQYCMWARCRCNVMTNVIYYYFGGKPVIGRMHFGLPQNFIQQMRMDLTTHRQKCCGCGRKVQFLFKKWGLKKYICFIRQ